MQQQQQPMMGQQPMMQQQPMMGQQPMMQQQPTMGQQPMMQQQMVPDMQMLHNFTLSRLTEFGIPQTIDVWASHQHMFFEGWPPMPANWIRMWSRSKNCVYYYRTTDAFSTMEWADVCRLG